MVLSISIDIREKKPHVDKIKKRLTSEKIPYVVRKLEVGDYVIEDENGVLAIIEHKSYADFIASLQNKHLESQLTSMDKSDALQYLFIDGSWERFRNTPSFQYCKLGVDSVNAYKINHGHKARIVEFPSEPQLIKGLVSLYKHIKSGTKKVYGAIPERTTTTGIPTMDILLAVDGIGYKTAERICKNEVPFLSLYILAHQSTPSEAKSIFKDLYGITVRETAFKFLGQVD